MSAEHLALVWCSVHVFLSQAARPLRARWHVFLGGRGSGVWHAPRSYFGAGLGISPGHRFRRRLRRRARFPFLVPEAAPSFWSRRRGAVQLIGRGRPIGCEARAPGQSGFPNRGHGLVLGRGPSWVPSFGTRFGARFRDPGWTPATLPQVGPGGDKAGYVPRPRRRCSCSPKEAVRGQRLSRRPAPWRPPHGCVVAGGGRGGVLSGRDAWPDSCATAADDSHAARPRGFVGPPGQRWCTRRCRPAVPNQELFTGPPAVPRGGGRRG